MLVAYRGSQDQEPQSRPQDAPSQTGYPSFVGNSSTYSQPLTAGNNASNSYNLQRPFERPQSPSHVSPAEAAGIISSLKYKSVDELRMLLTDKEAYNQFLLALDQVKAENNKNQIADSTQGTKAMEKELTICCKALTSVWLCCFEYTNDLDVAFKYLTSLFSYGQVRDEIQKEMLQLARSNLDKEPQIVELRNQCSIIRTTELAAALEKLNDLEKKKEELLKCYSSASLLHRLQEEMNKTDGESDNLHSQFLDREIELMAFVQKHKKLRSLYHRHAMTYLAAKTSLMP
ncbi:hypothetical protein SOVF_179590 isoform B [Spinacia oleracea]|nr:hypothetical protein SOVF_179590 isoform B [Spinacia oleracea]